MDGRSRRFGLAAALLVVALSGCGEDSTPGTTTAPEPQSPETLASALVEPADLGAAWSVTRMPDFPELSETGVVSDEAQDMLPRMEPCQKATEQERAAAEDLEWDAFRQLELATGTPTGSPSPGRPPVHHLVFAQEFLGEGAVDETKTTYDALVSGGDACLGTEKTRDGETVRTTGLTVPDLGDASHGWRSMVTEPGPAGRTATWDLRQVLVRDGGVLLMAQVAEITTPGVDTVLDDAEVEEMVQTMVDKLP
ncbi:hypothetical protein [Nocardioides sediminis]|uniref:hypothetical protein n=1 Tax=Nocardioides sediminis TaxID=433648 RepID=UPI000D2F9ABA|nr:hypothetical protein [Nocardioides sediminis]